MVHGVSELRLEESYRTCRRLQRRHDPTYYWATRCLRARSSPPFTLSTASCAARTRSSTAPGARRPARRGARRSTRGRPSSSAGCICGHSDHPVIAALVDAGPRHGLPLHLLGRYMDSMRVDCEEPVRIASRAQLDDYMEGSAATVGRVISPLLGAPEPEAVARLGVAFQLTNFIRDVPIDWRPRPRLPAGAARGRPARRRRQRPGARAHRPGGRARPRPVRRDRRRGPRRWRPGCAAACAWRGRSTRACSIACEGNGYDVLGAPGAPAPVGGRRARRAGRSAGRRAPTSSSAERRSPGSRSRASWPAPAPTCSSSTATRSARARPRRARRRRRGCTRWGSRARSAASCRR